MTVALRVRTERPAGLRNVHLKGSRYDVNKEQCRKYRVAQFTSLNIDNSCAKFWKLTATLSFDLASMEKRLLHSAKTQLSRLRRNRGRVLNAWLDCCKLSSPSHHFDCSLFGVQSGKGRNVNNQQYRKVMSNLRQNLSPLVARNLRNSSLAEPSLNLVVLPSNPPHFDIKYFKSN